MLLNKYAVEIILLVVGTALLIWRKEIAEFVYTTQRPWYKMLFGSLLDLDRPCLES